MEDKRTIKTKRNLKATLIQLLNALPFERITVSGLCRVAQTSRITFYTYYEDKYALAEELFDDFIREAVADYNRLQDTNNIKKDAIQGYYNMLDCILNLYYNHLDFFSVMAPQKNPYLYSSFYHDIFQSVESYVEQHKGKMPPKYSFRQTAALLCNGLWGVINECYDGRTPQGKLRRDVKEMYHDILVSNLFQSSADGD